MIRKYGSLTLFLTFSCAEYKSRDIIRYLRKVNGVSDSYSAGRLCTEDPIISAFMPIFTPSFKRY